MDKQHAGDVTAFMAQIDRRGPIPDSTVYFGSATFKAWTRLAEDMGDIKSINAGFGGGTFVGAVQHFDRVFDAVTPARIVIYFGENDICSDGITVDQAMELTRDFHKMVRARFPTTPVVYLPPKTSIIRLPWHQMYLEYARLLEEETKKDKNSYFADVASLTIGANGLPAIKFFERDGVHINPKGYAEWAKVIKKVFSEIG